jgi:hypothetical protein
MARMLFIGIDYYAYTPKICAAFAAAGYEADFHPIENVGFWSKTFKRFFPQGYRRRLDAYHRRIVEDSSSIKYDVVFFLQVHHLSFENLQYLRATQAAAKFILYNWDSISTHDFRPYMQYFDRVATFDPVDAVNSNSQYIPLFATKEFTEAPSDAIKTIDIYFVGSMVTKTRFDAIKYLHEYCSENGIRTHFHLRCSPPIRLSLFIERYFVPGLTLRSLDLSQISGLMIRSHAVFDFANHSQSGYTMRFIENLCAGKKIITDNRRVTSEKFYSKDRILVVEGTDYSDIGAFLDLPISSTIDLQEFSIDTWARKILA